MPELPEVETIRQQLVTSLPLKIEGVEFSRVAESIIKKSDRKIDLAGKKILQIRRVGKWLEMVLDSDERILSHLGMSGSWRLWQKVQNEKHAHVLIHGIHLEDGPVIWAYVDPRRFGKMYFMSGEKAEQFKSKLGIDVSSIEFTVDYVWQTLRKYPARAIKAFLLDQKYFAGVGNYIACEICAHARIRPTRRVKSLTLDEVKKIHAATGIVIAGQLPKGGLTFQGGYRDAFGEKGQGLANLVVFHQKVCGLCHRGKIKKIVLAQRGTFYCPNCQK
ncbi:MAG: Fpg/Nei family DNA glycosylase [Bdellovibrio sp.]|nr:Fpg/Nei family DNA glycosylase [Bdellovibrio sp.]